MTIRFLRLDNPLGIGGKLTVSLGFSVACHAETEALLREADEALYKAKGSGRDCVVAFRSGTVDVADLDDVA